MLEQYFVKPETVDRIRNSWLGEQIEKYVEWLVQNGYAIRNIYRRVPILRQFGEFAFKKGANKWENLPDYKEKFIKKYIREHTPSHRTVNKTIYRDSQTIINHFIRFLIPCYLEESGNKVLKLPFLKQTPEFFNYLKSERGNSKYTLRLYACHLRRFENYLNKIKLKKFNNLTPTIISAFIVNSSRDMNKTSMRGLCSNLRVFLQYLFREGLIKRDLSTSFEPPRTYRLADIPRSISWKEVRTMLECVERRTTIGKRDYAILLLLITYGLRSREVAALTLDHIEWERERILVAGRKAGHTTAYPLSSIVGTAIIDYLKNGRPKSKDRALFFRANAPLGPLSHQVISERTAHYLRKANVKVVRPGSHTLRHTCVQRLIDANFSFKVIGDYVAHTSPSSTKIYSKVAVDPLREIAQRHEEGWI